MKNKSLLIIALASMVVVQSCFKRPEPSFTYLPETNPEAGDTIFYVNTSVNATAYEWDLGNGIISTESEPYTIYDTPGNYDVTLKAIYKEKVDSITQSITINQATTLEFTTYKVDTVTPVFNDSLSILSSCTVWIYKNQDDWEKWTSPSSWNDIPEPDYFGLSDADGYVAFYNLEAINYHIIFYKTDGEDVYLSGGPLGPLVQNTRNAYWAVAFLLESEKKSTNSNFNLVSKPAITELIQ